MSRQRKTSKPVKGKSGKKVNGEPLTDKMKENPVRTLIYNGAFFRDRTTDGEFGEILEKGKLGKDFEIKRRGMVSNPVIIGKVEFEGMKDIEIELEISGDSFRASNTLREAGVDEDIAIKVGQIEFALQAGEHELVDELVGLGDLDPGPALGGIEGPFIENRKKDKERE